MPTYDYYEILEIHSAASQEVVDAAYRAIAKKLHPDNGGGATRLMQMVNEAYATLRDPAKRAVYDATHGASGGATRPVPVSMELPPLLRLPEASDRQKANWPKGTNSALQVFLYKSGVGSTPTAASVVYQAPDLEAAVSDVAALCVVVRRAQTKGPSDAYRRTMTALAAALADGLSATDSLFDEAGWNAVLVPGRPSGTIAVKCWFRVGDVDLADYPLPNNALLSLVALVRHLAVALEPEQRAYFANRLLLTNMVR